MPRTGLRWQGILCVAAVVALAMFAAGCGSKSSNSDSTSAADWADSLCSSISTWSTSVQTATSSLKGNATEDSLKSASADVKKATDEFVSNLKDLGAPDTESGKKAKETLDTLGDELNADLQTIDKAVKDVSGTTATLQAVSTVSSTLATVSNQVTKAFASLQQLDTKGELEDAFRNADSCKSLSKSGS